MSKHLRFGRLLSLLAIMLTLSFAWAQGQNLSSEKVLVTFGFTTAANPSAHLGSDCWGTVVTNLTTHTVAVTVPYGTHVDTLKASFTSSQWSNVFINALVPGLVGTSSVSGAGGVAVNYTSPVSVTVEAENHSFENYVVTVTKTAPSALNDITGFRADYGKLKACPHSPIVVEDMDIKPAKNVTFTGTNITFNVNYGAMIREITVRLEISPLSTVVPAVDPINGTALDFDPDLDGLIEPVTFVVTAENGSTKTYTVTPSINTLPSVEDNLVVSSGNPTMGFANATSVVSDPATQIITVVVPFTATTIAPTWTISTFAHMYTTEPPTTGAFPPEICSGGVIALNTNKLDTETFNFWIQAEDRTEKSLWVVKVTNAAASTVNTLDAIAATYTKTVCGVTYPLTGFLYAGVTLGASTIDFKVPLGVLSVKVSTFTLTPSLSTSTTGVGTVLTNGSSITIVAESGASKTYSVTVTPSTALAGNKKMLTFGFHKDFNKLWSFPAWTQDYAGTIDTISKRIAVTVAWNTDLHDLRAYFTTSTYACVTIAESNGMFTPQISDVTPNDHSNSLTYVVTAEDGTQERYEVIVSKGTALTGKDLLGFKLTLLPYCFGTTTYDIVGAYTGTNIDLSVKFGTNVKSLTFSYSLSPGATVVGPSSPADFTNPVTFTVFSEGGLTQVYTVKVATRVENSDKKILTYWFAAANNPNLGGADAIGVVDPNLKTVSVRIPWDARNYVNDLKASFTLSHPNARMTHSEDTQILQASGVTSNNFTTPVAYTVWAENCTTTEYFVTVSLLPNVNTGITAFTFASTPCATGCPLINRIDQYARRIYITLPHSMDISNLAPNKPPTLADGATITVKGSDPAQGWDTKKDWTKGPVVYTVTSADGSTSADWTVYVTNPPCPENDILTFSLAAQVDAATLIPGGHGVPVLLDKVNHKIDVIVKKGTNLCSIASTFSLSCGAVSTQLSNMNFCTGGCTTMTVIAEDNTEQVWTICVKEFDNVAPTATTWSVLADNCSAVGKLDSVAVQSNELGRVFIVNESVINMAALPSAKPNHNLADWTGTGSTSVANLVSSRLGQWVNVTAVDTPVYIKTGGLYSGTYWAFAVDNFGNISCISTQKLYVNICTVEVADLTTLRSQPTVWNFIVTGQVVVTYEENHTGGNWKFVQDAAAGILIEDRLNVLPAVYGEGTGLTGLKGTLVLDAVQMRFIPVCCYQPVKSSTGNVVAPIVLSYEDFKSQCYTTRTKYESMLVTINTPMKAFDDYTSTGHPYLTWTYNSASMYLDMDLATINAKGAYDYFVQSVLNSPLIGKVIPLGPAIYTGIRTNVNWGSIYGLITPRKPADIVLVDGCDIIANPNPAVISGVLPGTTTCAPGNSVVINVINQGVCLANITAVYLDDNAGVDGFDLITPKQVPFTLDTWAKQAFTVCFKPTGAGDKSTNLIVEYGIGKILTVPINGKVLVAYQMPYYQNFTCLAAPNDEWCYGRIGGNMNTTSAVHGWSSSWSASAEVLVYDGWGSQYDGLSVHMRNRLVVGGQRQPVIVQTPGVAITSDDAVVSFMEASMGAYYFANNGDPRNVLVSTDLVTWTKIFTEPASAKPAAETVGYKKTILSLKDYVGKTVFFRFEMLSPSNVYQYWIIDNFAVERRVVAPIIVATPNPGAFGGVQLGGSATVNFTVKNVGISVLKVKSVVVTGTGFAKVDTNTYPFEIADNANTYIVQPGGLTLGFGVTFTPTDVGDATGKIVITYGLYNDMTYEIPLTGKGLSCLTATVATIGENLAPTQGVWYTYTAEKFQITQITSCDPRNVTVPFSYSWDTYLELYKDCAGTWWSGTAGGVNGVDYNDDMEAACPTNRANSSLTVVMNAGETIKIFWKLAFPGTSHVEDPFYWHINPSYPIDGDVCETAIPLTLPVVNMFGTTKGFQDDYNISPCSPFSNYMDGNDVVYLITVADGYLIGNILGAYGSIHVLDVCPKTELTKDHCKAYTGGPNGGQFRKKIAAGTYFVIISTWAPPQTVDFLLNMSWESGSAVDNADLNSSLNVYPNPTNGKFTVSISNPEATDMTLELVNISGQVVYRNQVKAAYSYNEDIDATTFAKGVYYLKVNSAKGVKVEKVVVQ